MFKNLIFTKKIFTFETSKNMIISKNKTQQNMENTEFKKLLTLLESENIDNFRLGLTLLQNYKVEFKNYFDFEAKEFQEVIDFLVKNKPWNFEYNLFEMTKLDLYQKNIRENLIIQHYYKKYSQ